MSTFAELFPAPELDDRDRAILEDRENAWNKRKGPRVGDWIRFADGSELQISHLWDYEEIEVKKAQYTYGGSFYLGSDYQSFSGGLEPGIPLDSLVLTPESKPGNVWFFHHNQARAHNGVNATVACRVYETPLKTWDRYCMKCSGMVPGTHKHK